MSVVMGQKLSIVIPVYNMADSVVTLLRSIEAMGLWEFSEEVIVVDDGSSDDLLLKLSKWTTREGKVRILSQAENSGRFKARLDGARVARGDLVLFMDARVAIDEEFLPSLKAALEKSNFVQPQARVDVTKSVFNLYWDRSHRWIFRHHFNSLKKGPVYLSEANYDKFLKGTTTLLVPRQDFIAACLKYAQFNVLSDDTLILREMVKRQPLYMDDRLYVWWQPRQKLLSFLWRLVDRGPGLVEYHVFKHLTWVGHLVLFGLLVLVGLLVLLIMRPIFFFLVFAVLLAGAALSSVFLKPSLRGAVFLVPLHLSVLAAVSLGVVYGLLDQSLRWIKGESRQRE